MQRDVAKNLNPARFAAIKSTHPALAAVEKSDLIMCSSCFRIQNYCSQCKVQYKPGGNKGLTPANQEGLELAKKHGVVPKNAETCCYQRCRRKAQKFALKAEKVEQAAATAKAQKVKAQVVASFEDGGELPSMPSASSVVEMLLQPGPPIDAGPPGCTSTLESTRPSSAHVATSLEGAPTAGSGCLCGENRIEEPAPPTGAASGGGGGHVVSRGQREENEALAAAILQTKSTARPSTHKIVALRQLKT